MTIILLGFMIYPDLNLVMNNIRILNNNEISLNFRLIYFMNYTVQFPLIKYFCDLKMAQSRGRNMSSV